MVTNGWEFVGECFENNISYIEGMKDLCASDNAYHIVRNAPEGTVQLYYQLSDKEQKAEMNKTINKWRLNSGKRMNKYKRNKYLGGEHEGRS